jgi:uncharacterized protein YjbI with pentapeptide repeats
MADLRAVVATADLRAADLRAVVATADLRAARLRAASVSLPAAGSAVRLRASVRRAASLLRVVR